LGGIGVTFSASKISLTATCFEEKITAKSKKSKKEGKKGPESKNLFDFFDLAVKILPKLGSFSEHKSKRRCLGFFQGLSRFQKKMKNRTKIY
jgi:hypothetical protein